MCALFTVVMLPRLMSPRIAEYVFYPASVSYVIFSAMAKYFCNKVFNKWWFLTLKSTWSSPISIYCTIKWSTLNKISKLLYFIDLNMARAVRNWFVCDSLLIFFVSVTDCPVMQMFCNILCHEESLGSCVGRNIRERGHNPFLSSHGQGIIYTDMKNWIVAFITQDARLP